MKSFLIFMVLIFSNLLMAKSISLECAIHPIEDGFSVTELILDVNIDSKTNVVTIFNKTDNDIYKNKGVFTTEFIILKKVIAGLTESTPGSKTWQIDRKTLSLILKDTFTIGTTSSTNIWSGQCNIIDTSKNKI